MSGRIFDIRFTKPFLEQEYISKQKSIGQIAKEVKVGPSVIRRHLIYFAIPIRSASEAQALAESSGRRKNPTKGRKRRQDEIANLARGVSQAYHNQSPEAKEARANQLRAQYENMTDEQKDKFRTKGAAAVRDAAKSGSKMDIYVAEQLRRKGYHVEQHKQFIIENEKMHIDVFLPEINVGIEIDGPTHLRPVYKFGAEAQADFTHQQERDRRKNAQFIQSGLRIIRLGVERATSIPQREVYFELVLRAIDNMKRNNRDLMYVGDYSPDNWDEL